MAKKIIGVTVGTTSPRPDWRQANTKKADFIKNKPEQDLPNVTADDNNKILRVVDGKWVAAEINFEDGEDGYTPVKGKDYFTEADKKELISDLLASLPIAEEVSV